MHTVIAPLCTGCELCLPPCPVDCIEMRPLPADFETPAPSLNRSRYHAHITRDAHRRELRQREIDAKKAAVSRDRSPPSRTPL
jgi:electron transport complex protein RnfB